MPRNYDKDRVHCTSWSEGDEELYQEFLKDAEANHHGRLPGVYQKVVIGRYYKALREGRILPEGMNMQMFFSMMQAQQAQQVPAMATPVPAQSAYLSPAPTPTPAPAPRMSSAELAELEAVPDVVEANTDPSSMDDEMDFFLNQDDDD